MDRAASLVVGTLDDPHAASVVEAVEARGGQVLVLDAASLTTTDFVLGERGPSFYGDDGRELPPTGRGWLRRIAPESWHEGIRADGHAGVVRQAWTSAVASLVELAAVEWLSELSAMFAAEDKLRQLRACRELGLASPPTLLLTRPGRIPLEFGGDVIVKPFAAGHFREDTGIARVVFATAMSRDDPRLDLLAGAPFLVQPRLDAASHRRVVTVGEQVWVCELPAEGIDLDWRSTECAHSSFRRIENPGAAEDALRLAGHLGVGYSSQDWLVDRRGEAHFLDLNPAGQWMFLPVGGDHLGHRGLAGGRWRALKVSSRSTPVMWRRSSGPTRPRPLSSPTRTSPARWTAGRRTNSAS